MLAASSLTKKFDGFTALDSISCTIKQGCIYGLVGSNGSGKSTFLRLITGIYKPDSGSVTLDGKQVYENPDVKKHFAFVTDELYFLPQASMQRMAKLYAAAYEHFSFERFNELSKTFELDIKKNISTFSKGMKRQATTILALSTMPDYIFFDETFDGLDPIMRNLVKKVIYSDVCERGSSAVITSHSLRELEDTCDQLALLHKGRLIIESDVQNLKSSLFKIQVAFNEKYGKERFEAIDILSFNKKGMVANIIARGDMGKALSLIKSYNPVLFEALPLSLEEIFIYELDSRGYSFKNLTI
jgi:ABC-2 type transport system ATP-binding protein